MTPQEILNFVAHQVQSDLKILMLIRKMPQRLQSESLEQLEESMLMTLAQIEELKNKI